MRQLIAQMIITKENLPIRIEGSGDEILDRRVYKVRWSQETEDNILTFTLYSNGEWDYEDELDASQCKSGKTMSPHDRRWFGKMLKTGVAPAYAMAVSVEWKSLQERSKRYRA